MFNEILFKIVLFKGGVLIYAEHCIYKTITFDNSILLIKKKKKLCKQARTGGWWDVEVKGAGAAFPYGRVCSCHTLAQSGVP